MDSNLQEIQNRFLALAENSFELICEIDEQFRIAYTNPSYQQLLGFSPEQFTEKSFSDFIHPDDLEKITERLRSLFSQKNTTRLTFRHQNKENIYIWVEATAKAFTTTQNKTHAVLICRDASEQKQREDRLDFLANHDMLTGLQNRNALYDILSNHIEKARNGTPGTLLFLDLDHLKIVNDTIGHTAGDYLIEAIAGILQKLISPDDTLVRFAGDEFIVILNSTTLNEGISQAQVICHTIGNYHFTRNGQSFRIHTSVGVTQIDGRASGEEIISKADAACYTAKRNGGNRIEVFKEDNSYIQKLRSQSDLFNRLREAVVNNRVALWYQPIQNLKTQKTDWHEALLRVQEEDGSWSAPSNYLSAAERFQGTDQIDIHVITLAFRDLKEHPQLKISINLSGKSVSNPEIKSLILSNLKNISPERLSIEITETAFISNLSEAADFVRELQQCGIRFALDDFGSGFSSLAYLRDIPADYLKIDGGFIRTLAQENLNQTLVRAINDIAHILNKKTIAEYVHDAPTHALVSQFGIDYAQGFHLDKPKPIEEIIF